MEDQYAYVYAYPSPFALLIDQVQISFLNIFQV